MSNKPRIDDKTWLALPGWIRTADCHMVKNSNGLWYAIHCKPELSGFRLWDIFCESEDLCVVGIPYEFEPKFDGPWQESLVKIPERFVFGAKCRHELAHFGFERTACGNIFQLGRDRFDYCPYCGREIEL